MDTQAAPGQVTSLLRQWRMGDEAALTALAPLIYAELRGLARSRLAYERRSGLSPTELVHEAFLRLVRQEQPDWANRAHFYYIAARLMRQILVDFVRESHAQKRGGDAVALSLDEATAFARPTDPGVLQIHEALNALAEMDARKARVLEMRFFGGLTAEEIAQVENLSPVTVTRDVRAATAWLRAWLAAPEKP
ncbi:MAG: sigma-70 family RNA polymerase sigma factor [Bryobacterales bacterium]|nr:sigma-70 family RNA polymerase sigma factor [Bryobacterales bacterium]